MRAGRRRFGQHSTGYAYLTSSNRCQTCPVLLGKFCSPTTKSLTFRSCVLFPKVSIAWPTEKSRWITVCFWIGFCVVRWKMSSDYGILALLTTIANNRAWWSRESYRRNPNGFSQFSTFNHIQGAQHHVASTIHQLYRTAVFTEGVGWCAYVTHVPTTVFYSILPSIIELYDENIGVQTPTVFAYSLLSCH